MQNTYVCIYLLFSQLKLIFVCLFVFFKLQLQDVQKECRFDGFHFITLFDSILAKFSDLDFDTKHSSLCCRISCCSFGK